MSVGSNTVALTQGTTSVIVEPRGTTRLPDLNQLDMSFRKVFRVGGKMYQPRMDLYNLANSSTIIARVDGAGIKLRRGQRHPAGASDQDRHERGLVALVNW